MAEKKIYRLEHKKDFEKCQEKKKYRLDQLNIRVEKQVTSIEDTLRTALAEKLKIREDEICNLKILRKSLDARKRNTIHYVYSVVFSFEGSVSDKTQKRILQKTGLKEYEEEYYCYPQSLKKSVGSGTEHRTNQRPVIVGTGPAGLFCGYFLALAGLNPILLERGKRVEERTAAVNLFWNDGKLDPECNVQFGEGGAGTFSDGKLNSSVLGKNPAGNEVLRIFVKYGADEEILYSNKPHIGTDQLKTVITAMRKDMERMGAEFRFSSRFDEPILKDERITGIRIRTEKGETEELDVSQLILCIGHSARDTFKVLRRIGVIMEQKPFAVGLRIQHPQSLIDEAQYGSPEKYERALLPAADYKLTMTASSGRGVYSFCMCPGGYVVNASSETGRLAVNGMSDHARNSGVANSAIVASVDSSIVGTELFDGIRFQRRLEEKAFLLGEGAIPVECFGDFVYDYENCDTLVSDLKDKKKSGTGQLDFSGILHKCDPEGFRIRGAYRYSPLHQLLPQALYLDLCEGIRYFGTKIRGFDRDDALLAGVESRTSSPIRILRDDSGQCSIRGIYPCGEGAGYAGGITSAAADGIKIAEKIISYYDI